MKACQFLFIYKTYFFLFFTFEHLDRYSGGLIWEILVDAKGFSSDHLTKAALSERFSECQARERK